MWVISTAGMAAYHGKHRIFNLGIMRQVVLYVVPDMYKECIRVFIGCNTSEGICLKSGHLPELHIIPKFECRQAIAMHAASSSIKCEPAKPILWGGGGD